MPIYDGVNVEKTRFTHTPCVVKELLPFCEMRSVVRGYNSFERIVPTGSLKKVQEDMVKLKYHVINRHQHLYHVRLCKKYTLILQAHEHAFSNPFICIYELVERRRFRFSD